MSQDVSFAARVSRVLRGRSFQEGLKRVMASIVVTVGSLVLLFPIVWMLSTSLKTRFGALSVPPEWIPADPQWGNYRDALTFNPFHIYFRNTLFYVLVGTFGTLISNAFIAHGFARLQARGRDKIFLLVLATMMLPYPVTLVPTYILFDKLHWLDSFKPLLVPSFFGDAWNIFLLRQFFRGIPKEIEDAAHIDGCGYFGVWWRIMLPLSRPALAAVAILSFMWRWNDFMGPLVFLDSTYNYTLSLGLQMFRAPFVGIHYPWLMAASLVTVLPCIVVFFVTQRYFVQGIVVTGLKG